MKKPYPFYSVSHFKINYLLLIYLNSKYYDFIMISFLFQFISFNSMIKMMMEFIVQAFYYCVILEVEECYLRGRQQWWVKAICLKIVYNYKYYLCLNYLYQYQYYLQLHYTSNLNPSVYFICLMIFQLYFDFIVFSYPSFRQNYQIMINSPSFHYYYFIYYYYYNYYNHYYFYMIIIEQIYYFIL